MPDVFDDIDKFSWFHPGDVLMIKDTQGLVVAYGVPGGEEESEGYRVPDEMPPKKMEPEWGSVADPLPMPKHTNPSPGKPCLGCEWVGLKRRIADAS